MEQKLKRLLDLIVGAGGLLALAPLLIGIAAAVRLSSPGPILFRQKRAGRFGRSFEILKFRTMFLNSPDLRLPDGSTFSSDRDARVTRVGRVLRQTSLDELPQLWNVLAGDMSLVGPRPDLPDQIQHYSLDDLRKLDVKPGITGLAQISGRNGLCWQERRKLDRQYVERWSFGLDLRILAATIPYVLLQRGIQSSAGPASRACLGPELLKGDQ